MSTEPAKRLFVCDDNAVNRKIAVSMASRCGFDVAEAEDGFRALEILAAQQFDVLLFDISMPGMSGDELLATFLATHPDPRPRILAYTAHAFPGERTRLLEAGFDDLLVKPMSLTAFQQACC